LKANPAISLKTHHALAAILLSHLNAHNDIPIEHSYATRDGERDEKAAAVRHLT
jgi:hypothetical protein